MVCIMRHRKINLPNLENNKHRNGHFTYYYRYTIANNKRQRVYLGNSIKNNVTIVKERYRAAISKIENLKYGLGPITEKIDEGQKPIYLVDIWADWISHESNRAKSWLRDLHNLKHFVIYFGNKSDWDVKFKKPTKSCRLNLAKLETKDINDFYKNQYALGNSNETVKKRHQYLNPLYTWLVNEKLLLDNYYERKMKLKDASDTRVHYQVLSRIQAELIVDNAPNDYCKTLWTIMLDTAMSPVDARNLSEEKHLVNGVDDNGEFVECLVTSRQKSGKHSAIPISDRIKALGHKIWNLDVGENKSRQDKANVKFKKLCAKLGIVQNDDEKLTQYSFRHSLATHLVNQGYKIDTVQRILGHTLGSSVTRGYLANEIASEVQRTKQVLNKKG